MALTYDGAGGIFTHLGKYIARIDSYATIAGTTLPADLSAILTSLGTLWLPAEGLAASYEQYKSNVNTWRQTLGRYCDKRLLDQDTVVSQLGLPTGTSIQVVVTELIKRMLLDAETVNASVVTVGAVTAGPASSGAANHGDGRLFLTKVLDGYSSPGGSMPSNLVYDGLDSQLAVPSETMVLECVADAEQDNRVEGQESFSWSGGPAYPDLDYRAEGSGQGPTITCGNASSIIQNKDFENWSGNTPNNWTIANGTAGTHVFKESTNVFRGTYGLKFLGTGAQAAIGLTQAVSQSLLQAKRRYLVAVAVKASSVPAAGDLEIKFTGTGYTADSPTVQVETVQIAGTPSGGTYTLTWMGQTTAAIAYNANAATVQEALRLLAGLESVVVTTIAGSPPNQTHQLTLHGVQGNTPLMTYANNMTGGTPTITVAAITTGIEGEKIVLPAATLPTAWSLRYFWINLPTVVPSDFTLSVAVTGTLSNGVSICLDSLLFSPVAYHGGIGAVIAAGASQWLKGDRLSFTVANDQGGKFSDFFRRHYLVQLPSKTDASETISDSLVA